MKAVKQTTRLSPDAEILLKETAIDSKRPIGVILAIYNPPCSEQLHVLKANGLRVKTVAGDVITAELPVGALRRLANLDFVRYVELARPLSSEGAR